jgi:hypothetical protein
VSRGSEDSRQSVPPGYLGLRREARSEPGAKPVATGEQHLSMDLPENDHYEWSDWFTKARPASSEQESPAADAPGEAEAETVPEALA